MPQSSHPSGQPDHRCRIRDHRQPDRPLARRLWHAAATATLALALTAAGPLAAALSTGSAGAADVPPPSASVAPFPLAGGTAYAAGNSGDGPGGGAHTTAASDGTPYVDVNPQKYAWALPAIKALRKSGLMVGVDATHFDPAAPLTRAQMATLFARLHDYPLDGIGPHFSDVSQDAWYTKYVAAASGNGLLLGVGGDRFAPQAPVTRAMTSVVAARSLGLGRVAQDLQSADLPFADAATVPGWARGAVSVGQQLGVMIGDAAGFRPDDTVTRAEAAVVLQRVRTVTTPDANAQGNRAVDYISISAGAADLNVGQSTAISTWGHDADTYLIPANVRYSATHGTVTANGRFTASQPGTAVVTARAGGASRQLSLTVHQPAKLTLGQGTPPVALVNTAFPIAVAVLDTTGSLDTADSGRTVTLTLTAPDGTKQTLTDADGGGWATFQPSLAQAGTYTLAASAPGLPGDSQTVRAVAQPIGTLQVSIGGQNAAGTLPDASARANLAVHASIVGSDGQPLAERFPVHFDVTSSDGSIRFSDSSELISGDGDAGVLVAVTPGSGDFRISVPGGAVAPVVGHVAVVPRGALQVVSASPTGIAVGQQTQIRVRLVDPHGRPLADDGVVVTLTPHGPHGYDMPHLTAKTVNGVATFDFSPMWSGAYSFTAGANGYVGSPLDPNGHPVTITAPGSAAGDAYTNPDDARLGAGLGSRHYADGTASTILHVAPGPLTQLVVKAAPSTLLAPGQKAKVYAALADKWGNPIGAPFRLSVKSVSAAGAFDGAPGEGKGGQLTGVDASMAGPGTAATFTASSAGTRTYVFSSPDHPQLAPVRVTFRVLPQPGQVAAGKGLWLMWKDWTGNDDDAIIQRAVEGGFTHIYMEIATTGDGFYGRRAVDEFMWKVHNAGLAYLAWTYPALRDPAEAVARGTAVVDYRTPAGEAADAFAPDIEEVMSPAVVQAYAKDMRAALGSGGRLVAITYPPNSRPNYPFKELAPYTDVFAPMSYWHHRMREDAYVDAYRYVAKSVRDIRAAAGAKAVVSVIGQTYDMFAGGGQGVYSPTPLELQAALQAVKDTHAIGLSFYRYGTTTPEEWQALNGMTLR